MRSVKDELWYVVSKSDSSMEDVIFSHEAMISGAIRMQTSLEWDGRAVLL